MIEQDKDKSVEYTFIFMNGGWWLKVSTVRELTAYLLETDSRWEKYLNNLLNSKEFTRYGNEHADVVATSIGLFGVNNGLEGVTAANIFRERIVQDQFNEINSGNTIAINSVGGYFVLRYGKDKKYSQWCKRKELVFPSFKKEELKIKRFPMGNHWYAYLGDMQIRDNDKLKWNSYEEAYEYAKQFIEEDKKK